MTQSFSLRPVGHVESPLDDPDTAPKQGDEGSPEAWVVFHAPYAEATANLEAGTTVLLLTWFDRASREVLSVQPRGDASRPLQGVFTTRSPHRPNPIGLHRVRIVRIASDRMLVADLEALDGTPVLDVKPVLGDVGDR